MLGNKEIMARNIRKYMKLNNKTRNDVCKALGIKYTTFTDWVNGNAYPRIDKIELMANYFGIPKSALVEDSVRDSQLEMLCAIYQAFNDLGKAQLLDYAEFLATNPRLRKDAAPEEEQCDLLISV